KQFVPVTPAGHVIGDVVLTWEGESRFNVIGRPPTANWLTYQAEKGKYDVQLTRDERAVDQKGPVTRKAYRFQIQGPNAMKTIEAATGAKPPELKFFNMCDFTI